MVETLKAELRSSEKQRAELQRHIASHITEEKARDLLLGRVVALEKDHKALSGEYKQLMVQSRSEILQLEEETRVLKERLVGVYCVVSGTLSVLLFYPCFVFAANCFLSFYLSPLYSAFLCDRYLHWLGLGMFHHILPKRKQIKLITKPPFGHLLTTTRGLGELLHSIVMVCIFILSHPIDDHLFSLFAFVLVKQ